MRKPLWVFAIALAGVVPASGAESASQDKEAAAAALKAYAVMDYTRAGMQAKLIPHLPEGKLVSALCALYDRSRQDVKLGQLKLEELFESNDTPLAFRLEAGVALGRTVQLMKERRELYGDLADRYDHNKIYAKVRELGPGTQAERDVFFYQIRERLEDPAQADAAFEDIEAFFRDFKGESRLLAPVHLLAEYQYIRNRGDYKNAARHLRAGYEIGFANPNENRSGLFRLGFLYHKKLEDKALAIKYFKEYLERYPYSGQAVVAKRFLEDLGESEAAK